MSATRKRRRPPIRSISMICSRRHCRCCKSTRTSPHFIGVNFNSSWSTNIRTRTKSRPISSISSRANIATSWSSATTRNRSIPGVAPISKTSSNFRNVILMRRKFEMNYRSVPEILQVANTAIAANVDQFQKNLRPTRESAATKPAVVALNDGSEQAQFIAQRILELRDEDVDLNEIAVLYRAHYHALELQLELSRRGIPYQITSGIRFFEQAHIKDVVSFLRFVANPRDEVAFKRMVKLLPGIGNRSAENLWNAWDKSLNERGEITSWSERLLPMNVSARSKKHWTQLALTLDEIAPGGQPNPPSAMITSVVEAIYDDYAKVNFANYELRREDLNQLAAFSQHFKDVNDFLSQLALISNVDAEAAPNQTGDKEAVNLSTVHQAKGLEFHTVFVIL